jgi:methionyl-tRNA synthetase
MRALSVLLQPYMPASTVRLLKTIGSYDLDYASAEFGERPAIAEVTALEPLFPKRA